jgi:hypothetical protein
MFFNERSMIFNERSMIFNERSMIFNKRFMFFNERSMIYIEYSNKKMFHKRVIQVSSLRDLSECVSVCRRLKPTVNKVSSLRDFQETCSADYLDFPHHIINNGLIRQAPQCLPDRGSDTSSKRSRQALITNH